MIINIKVYPKSKLQKIEKNDNLYKVHLVSAPEKGKANKELFQILSDYFHISKNQMIILQGATHRNKTIKINTSSKDETIDDRIKKINHKSLIPKFIDRNKKHLSRIHCWDRYIDRGR